MEPLLIDYSRLGGRCGGRGAGAGCAAGAAALEKLRRLARKVLGEFRRGRPAAVATMTEQMEELQGRADRRYRG